MRWAYRYHRSGYTGLRLTADEYFSLPDDGNRYELLDGVMIRSPSPTPKHQFVGLTVLRQLEQHVTGFKLALAPIRETFTRFA